MTRWSKDPCVAVGAVRHALAGSRPGWHYGRRYFF